MKNPESTEVFAQDVVKSIINVTKSRATPLHEPEFDGNEWNYVKECIDTNFVSSAGKFVDKFERQLEEYTGSKHAIAVSSGTAALHISLILAGVKSDDEVLVPALTFIATANAVVYCGAEPHFVESDRDSLGIDPEKLRTHLQTTATVTAGLCRNKKTGRVIRAIIPMHTFGHPAKIHELLEICMEFNIAMVEDAAESLGSFYSDKHTGTFGLLGTLSFNGNKIITTGGGGAILTDDSHLAAKAKHLTTTAKLPHPWKYVHDEVGYNYRLPNLNAALGCAQLEGIEEKVRKKRKLFESYRVALQEIIGISLFCEPICSRSNYWLQTLILDDKKTQTRDRILEIAYTQEIQLRPTWDLVNTLAPYRNSPSMDLEVARALSNSLINVPSSPGILDRGIN
jgi:aminotransferase in exopolysaccharide biosynthesis